MKIQMIGLLTVLVSLSACKKDIENEKPIDIQRGDNVEIIEECYAVYSQKDTVFLHLKVTNSEQVSGTLQYKFYEKDRNGGTFKGIIKGDSLIANYTFTSEGKTSSRELVFLKKGDAYLEGYGEIVENNSGKVTFKNHKELQFDNSMLLSKTDCQ
jgi:hypothetical protein